MRKIRRSMCSAASLLAGMAVLELMCAASAHTADEPVLDPNQRYQAERSNPVTYDVDFSVVVTAPAKTKLLKVWLPLPRSYVGQEVSADELTTFPMKVAAAIAQEKTFGNKFAYFEFAAPQGAQIIRHRFKIKVWELHWNIDPEKIVAVDNWPAAFDRYRRGETQAVVVDERFEKLVKQIVPTPSNPLRDMASVIAWVGKNIQYDHNDASLQASSVHLLEEHRGHCSDYHGFCAAMGRAMGYPTRVTYGINAFPKNSPSHCKLEVFLPPYGWVSFDVSETQNMMAAIKKKAGLQPQQKSALIAAAQDRLLRGFRDNTWYIQTRGSDYALVPPAETRVPVVRTAYIEADGLPLRDPDPANTSQHEFSWMTVQQFVPDHPVTYPFKDFTSLEPKP
jgi:transglutaminase-like putative cysteine protease